MPVPSRRQLVSLALLGLWAAAVVAAVTWQHPDFWTAPYDYYREARFFRERGRLPKALEVMDKALRRDPETKEARYAIVQAEDELASINMAIGASYGGVPSLTATSGPGLSLMTEAITLHIDGMTCSSCAEHVRQALEKLE